MKFSRYFAIFISALVLWSAVEVFSTVPNRSTVPNCPDCPNCSDCPDCSNCSTTPATVDVETPRNFPQLRTDAFRLLLSGDFTGGSALLDSACLRAAADDTVVKARALTAEYLKIRAKSDAERTEELASAVKRVKLAQLSWKFRPELVKAKLADKLWKHVRAITDSVTSADEFLAAGSTSQPADPPANLRAGICKDALEHLDAADKELTASCALIMGRKGPWPDAFRASAKNLTRAISEYRKAWIKDSQPDSHPSLKNASGKVHVEVRLKDNRSYSSPALKKASEKVHDALIDMGVMITKEPLMAALLHTNEAMELSDDSEAFRGQKWVAELIREADEQGKKYVAEGKWLDALMIYGRDGLGGIDRDNIAFKDMLKKTTRYVRVQGIYGSVASASETPTTAPSENTSEPEEPKWKSMITGIDTKMVRTAIEQIDANYVKKPDYRKIGLAGLGAVRILISSSEAAETLDALKDKQKCRVFLKGLDRQVKRLEDKKESVDYLDVTESLNRVLDLNSDTLNLPVEVLNMEFAEGMLSSLDKFTSMIWPYQEANFRKRTMGSFCGIGVQIRKDPGRAIEVVTPLPDTPAFRAGIRAGDYIVRVGETETRMMDLEQVVKMITGKRGTSVVLTIRRAGRSKPFEVSIRRDTIHIQTIKGWRLRAGGKWDFFIDPVDRIGYIRLTQFTADTTVELRKALKSLRQANPPVRGVIVDMRFNPGGLLSAAEDVSDEFLSRGLIVQIKGRGGQSQKNATFRGSYQRGEVIVLVNQHSASASEIVAGALKDWGRATIVGQRTYGKGSVQRPMPLRSRLASLKLTTAYYYLPSGRCLHRTNGAKTWGVDPDVPVKVTVRQTNRWAEIRQETDIIKSVNADRLTELLKKQLGEDVQLQTALLLMRLKILAKTQPAQPAKAA